MNNVSQIGHDQCSGCASCAAVCTKKCIEMAEDSEGFLYPAVVMNECVECGKCVTVCPVETPLELHRAMEAYACQGKDRESTRKSSSGAAAALLGEHVIKNSGVVFGCSFDQSFKVRHICVTEADQLDSLRGSKYVQSDFSDVYGSIRDVCESGRMVAVFGTPCQIASVRTFLGKEYENLLLVDLICHGVPNQWLFDRYLEWKVKKMGGKMVAYTFRDKTKYDWGTVYRATTTTTTITTTGAAPFDPYYSAFLYAETYRESCYNCRYAQLERPGDITVGDYWGIARAHPEFASNCKDGVSAVLVNTEKGRRYISALANKAIWIPSEIKKVVVENGNLLRPAARPTVRDRFYKEVRTNGFQWAEKYMRSNRRYYVSALKMMIPAKLKTHIKRIVGK